ncbi:restriction endonuclease subunit S [Pseudoxanthomonas mexicana]
MRAWKPARIEDIAERIVIGPFGSRMKSEIYTESGVPVIRGTNLTGGKTFSGDWVYVSEETADSLASCNAVAGDLVFPHRGAIGEVGIVPGDRRRYMLLTSLMMLRCDAEQANPLFLYYFFKSDAGRHELLKNASQVGTPGIGQPLTSLKAIELLLPTLEEQHEIARVLVSLDDKIALNRHLSETLEAIAQALFQSWFVDFDPVRAKASGEASESICQRLGLTTELLALFPEQLVDSELGEIPEGWTWSDIGSQIKVLGGGTPSTKNPEYWDEGSIYWATPKDLSGNKSKVILGTDRKITEAGLASITSELLPTDTVLLSSRAPVGYLALTKAPMAINQGFIAMKCDELLTPEFVLHWAMFSMPEIQQRASGTTFQEISKKNFRTIPVLIPNVAVVEAFSLCAKFIYEKITENIAESTCLGEMRDSLLPKLLSGEISPDRGRDD